ncbi:hypothetical protein B0J14DRAFT_568192 [Halenospora varia]|nr:hypothetical protein B0J14DRAFT_568192 [Halenospora varia]
MAPNLANDMTMVPLPSSSRLERTTSEQSLTHEETSRLEIFTNILPDAQQELVVQILLNTFTLFPTLPLELRRKIWTSTFANPKNFAFSRGPDIPATLGSPTRPLRRMFKASFFDFERDWMHFGLGDVVRKLYPNAVPENLWLPPATYTLEQVERLYVQINRTYEKVQRLEVRCCFAELEHATDRELWTVENIVDALGKGKLPLLKALKEVRLVRDLRAYLEGQKVVWEEVEVHEDDEDDDDDNEESEEEEWRIYKLFVEAFHKYFDEVKANDDSFVTPTITLDARSRY